MLRKNNQPIAKLKIGLFGAAYADPISLVQTPNRSEDFENLYFVVAGTHPGAGLPSVLSSAIIAEELITAAGQTVIENSSHIHQHAVAM